VSEDKLQRDLQDYLDDRLDADRRKQFEQRLTVDETLARQVVLAQRTREVLRRPDEELSDAFYTRTVARFAEDRRRAPFGLSWSTAGLAVATIAAAVLFVPGILKKEIAVPETPQIQGDISRPSEESRTKDAELLESLDELDSTDRDLAEVEGEESNPANAPKFSVVGADAEPEPAPVLQAPQPKRQAARSEDSRARSDAFKFADVSLSSAIEIADDVVGVGEIELLDMRETQLDLLAGLKKDLQAPNHGRYVAIGKRPGLDACSALNVRQTEKAWEIDYENSGSRVGAVSCAIILPSDGLEIRFQGWSVDE
jgi:hypothetical protein